MKNWKIISATLLAASLVTATTGQAWASTTTDLETINLQSILENEDVPTTLKDDSELVSSIIVPTGYLANNIFALMTNSEKISNPNAKEALLNNIERAIARWEAKKIEDDAVIETPEEEVIEEVEVIEEEEEVEVIEEEEVVPEAEESQDEDSDKEEEKTLAEQEAKKNAQVAKVEAIKAANLAKKEAREEAKQAKKEEQQSNKQDKQSSKSENKGNNK